MDNQVVRFGRIGVDPVAEQAQLVAQPEQQAA
jgi:hypothetical protein